MKKSFVQVQLKGNSLLRKGKMHMLLTLILTTGLLMALFFVLKPASPAIQKSAHRPVGQQQEKGGDEPLYSGQRGNAY